MFGQSAAAQTIPTRLRSVTVTDAVISRIRSKLLSGLPSAVTLHDKVRYLVSSQNLRSAYLKTTRQSYRVSRKYFNGTPNIAS